MVDVGELEFEPEALRCTLGESETEGEEDPSDTHAVAPASLTEFAGQLTHEEELYRLSSALNVFGGHTVGAVPEAHHQPRGQGVVLLVDEGAQKVPLLHLRHAEELVAAKAGWKYPA
jgi:hypothetical protein